MCTDVMHYSPLSAARYVMGEKEHAEALALSLKNAPEGSIEAVVVTAAVDLASICIDETCGFYRVIDGMAEQVPMVDGLNACDALRHCLDERVLMRRPIDEELAAA